MHVLAFSSKDSGTRPRISHHDAAVRDEPGTTFVSVMLARHPGNGGRGGLPKGDWRNRLRSFPGEG